MKSKVTPTLAPFHSALVFSQRYNKKNHTEYSRSGWIQLQKTEFGQKIDSCLILFLQRSRGFEENSLSRGGKKNPVWLRLAIDAISRCSIDSLCFLGKDWTKGQKTTGSVQGHVPSIDWSSRTHTCTRSRLLFTDSVQPICCLDRSIETGSSLLRVSLEHTEASQLSAWLGDKEIPAFWH